MKMSLSILLSIVLLMGISGTASAITVTNTTTSTAVFFDDFENVDPVSSAAFPDVSGDYDPVAQLAGTGYCSFYSGGTGAYYDNVGELVQVADYAGAAQGDNYLRISATSIEANFGGAQGATDAVTIEFMANIPTGNLTQLRVFAEGWGGGHVVELRTLADGSITNWANPDVEDTGLTFTPDEWEKWTVEMSGDADYTLTIGSQAPITLVSRYGRAANNALLGVGWEIASGNQIGIDAIPEPATMLLLGLGGLLLRRRK